MDWDVFDEAIAQLDDTRALVVLRSLIVGFVAQLRELRGQVDDLKRDVADLEHRLDMTERKLSNAQDTADRQRGRAIKAQSFIVAVLQGEALNELRGDVDELLSRGKKLEAIKAVRSTTGIGLREAKDVVDQVIDAS